MKRQTRGNEEPTQVDSETSRARNWGNQILGALIGGAVALAAAAAVREMGWISGPLIRWMLWGGVIGGLVGASERLAQAGKRLTRRDETWLNVFVALIGMALVFTLIFGLAYGAGLLVRWYLDSG